MSASRIQDDGALLLRESSRKSNLHRFDYRSVVYEKRMIECSVWKKPSHQPERL